MSERRAKSAV